MADGKLSANFKRKEFWCKGEDCCNHSLHVHPQLIDSLETLRALVLVPLIINSGYRCKKHNDEIGGEINSYHMSGLAADVRCPKHLTVLQFAEFASLVPLFYAGGIGLYDTFIHVDIRGDGKARWDRRTA